jgi:hypothetical protein
MYRVLLRYPESGVFPAGIVNAVYDADQINFSVNVASFTRTQNMSFAYAQLRDQALTVLTPTQTNNAPSFMVFVSSAGAYGQIRGSVRIVPGFASRFPAVGNVFLEVFGYNILQSTNTTGGVPGFPGIPQSLGLSNPIDLVANATSFTAYNNILKPGLGHKATFKFSISKGGHVTLRLYTMSGVFITTLIDGDYPPGSASVDWYGRNSAGNTVASGVYLAHINGPSGLDDNQKVVVVK